MSRRIPDNFFLGALAGAVIMCGGAMGIGAYRRGLAHVPPYFMEPKPELLILVVNIFLFRMLVVKAGYERTGRGLLFVTIALVMFYYFGRMKQGAV